MPIFTPISSTYYPRKDLIVSAVSSERDTIYITDSKGNLKYKFGGYGHTYGKFSFCAKSYTYPCVTVKTGESVAVNNEILLTKENITNCQKIFTLYLEHGNLDFSQSFTISDGVEIFSYDANTGTLKSTNTSNVYPQYIDEFSGRVILTFLETPTNNITASYSYFNDMVICSDTFNHRVQLLTFDGKPVASLEAKNVVNAPCGISLNSDESELFICSRGTSQIIVFDMNTYEIKTFFGEYGHNDGQLRAPHDIYLVDDNTVVVTDTGNNRLVQFIKQGDTWVADNPYVLYKFSNNTHKSYTLGALAVTSDNSNGYIISDYHVGVLALYNEMTGEEGTILIDRGFTDENVYFPKGIRLKNGSNILLVANNGRYADILNNNGLPKPSEMKIEYNIEDVEVDYIIDGGNISELNVDNYEIFSGSSITDDLTQFEIISGGEVVNL